MGIDDGAVGIVQVVNTWTLFVGEFGSRFECLCVPPSTAFQNSETPNTLDFSGANVWGHLGGMCKSPLVLSKHIPGCHAAANPKDRQPERIPGAPCTNGVPHTQEHPRKHPRKHPRLAHSQDKASWGYGRMRDTHPRPLGWGSLQMLPCFNAAQQGMTHPSVPPYHFPSQLEMDALISPQQRTLFGIQSVKLLAVSCCCFSPGEGVRCVGNAKEVTEWLPACTFARRVCCGCVFQCFLWQSPPLLRPGWRWQRAKLRVVVTKV